MIQGNHFVRCLSFSAECQQTKIEGTRLIYQTCLPFSFFRVFISSWTLSYSLAKYSFSWSAIFLAKLTLKPGLRKTHWSMPQMAPVLHPESGLYCRGQSTPKSFPTIVCKHPGFLLVPNCWYQHLNNRSDRANQLTGLLALSSYPAH